MKNFFNHIRVYIFRGLLAVIPILLCAFAVELLYHLIDKKVLNVLNRFIEVRKIPGLGILLVLIVLYVIGLIVGNIIGRQVLKGIESITKRIPFINVVYGVGQQVSQSFLVTDDTKQTFKKAVLVNWNNNSGLLIGFVTGQMNDAQTGEELLRVFMPHVPTPFSGFVLVVKKSQTIDPGWTVEEALKMLVSAGIVSPSKIK